MQPFSRLGFGEIGSLAIFSKPPDGCISQCAASPKKLIEAKYQTAVRKYSGAFAGSRFIICNFEMILYSAVVARVVNIAKRG